MQKISYPTIYHQLLDLIRTIEHFKYAYYRESDDTQMYMNQVNDKVKYYLMYCERATCTDDHLFYYQYVQTLKTLHNAPLCCLDIGNTYHLAEDFKQPLLQLIHRLTLTDTNN